MSKQTKYLKTNVLGLDIDCVTIEEAVTQITDEAKSQSYASYIVKPYVEFVDYAKKHAEMMNILNNATWCLSDGVALQWAAYYLNKPHRNFFVCFGSLLDIIFRPSKLKSIVPERISGITFTKVLLEHCVKKNLRVYLVGSPQKHKISLTAAHLEKQFPGLEVVGTFAGRDPKTKKFSGVMEKDLLKQLHVANPDIILVGLGFPRQEQLMARLSSKLEHGILIGEGGTFDYKEFGGHIARAPALMRKSGLEWLWRLLRQPRRLKRQLAIPRFIGRVYSSRKLGANSKKLTS